jgi:hypothetical protein
VDIKRLKDQIVSSGIPLCAEIAKAFDRTVEEPMSEDKAVPQEPVTDTERSLLPPEPIPGQFYRTKSGRKFQYIGKNGDGWMYEDIDNNDYLYCFYHSPYSMGFDNTPEIVAPWTEPSALPAEPTAGQFYRTRDGNKVQYVGKVKYSWVYMDEASDELHRYSTPFFYLEENDSDGWDIIAPWSDPLPAIEIRRWAIIAKIDLNDDDGVLMKRGEYIGGYASEDAANKDLRAWSNSAWYEIVELVGTLPSRETT